MIQDQGDYEYGNPQSSDDEQDLVDLITGDDSNESLDPAIRIDFVERVFSTLSADAQRGERELKRADIDRAYLRKQLSIAECMAVEGRLLASGYRIIDDDELDNESVEEGRQKHHYLNEAEEKALGRQIQLALRLPEDACALDQTYVERIRRDAARARATFVATNIRFVEQLARRMGQHQHLSLEDITQEGFIGLLRAADLYDPERGFRFKTYAAWWIQQRMRRAIADGDRTIRLPVYIQGQLSQIKRSQAKLKQLNGISPSIEDLASALGMETERLMKLLWYAQSTECTEGDMPIGEDTHLLSLVVDESESSFDVVLHQELRDRFHHLLATLKPREAQILRMRFGIDLVTDHTLESIGQQFDLTRERIRQIEAKAIKKLQHPTRSDMLRDFLDD